MVTMTVYALTYMQTRAQAMTETYSITDTHAHGCT